MKNVKDMTYQEMTNEIVRIHLEMRTASLKRRRELVIRAHELTVEMDRRWN